MQAEGTWGGGWRYFENWTDQAKNTYVRPDFCIQKLRGLPSYLWQITRSENVYAANVDFVRLVWEDSLYSSFPIEKDIYIYIHDCRHLICVKAFLFLF